MDLQDNAKAFHLSILVFKNHELTIQLLKFLFNQLSLKFILHKLQRLTFIQKLYNSQKMKFRFL